MAVNRGLFVRSTGTAPNKVGTTPVESRLALAGLVAENAPGAPRSGVLAQSLNNPQTVVAASSGAMTYVISPFEAVINRSAAEGVYVVTVSGATQVATDPSPGTGSRWDIVYVKQNDVDKGDANNFAVLDVAKGVAGTSPTKPGIPTGAMALAEARIYAATTTTAGGTNTLTQLHDWTAARGAPIPVRSLTDRQNITAPMQGQQVVRLDRDGEIQTYTGWTGTGWEYLSRPRRYYADTLTFDGTSNQLSKLIGSVTSQGTRAYPTKMRVNGRLAVSCGAIASGLLSISVNVSCGVASASLAQAKSRLTFVPPGGYWATAAAETDWISIGSGGDGLCRIWIEHLSGTVNHASTSTAVYSHLWVEVMPADD